MHGLFWPDPERYTPLGVLKAGPRSTAFLAQEVDTGRYCVLRQLHPPSGTVTLRSRGRFQSVASRLQSVEHAGIQPLEELFKGIDQAWSRSTFIPGLPADRANGQVWDTPRVIWWTSQLLDALSHLHHQTPPIIIGSLDASDIVLGPHGIVIVDMGIYEHVYPEHAAMLRSRRRNLFHAPERENSSRSTVTSDIYSAAAVAHWMLLGEAPPHRFDPDLVRQRLEEKRPDLPTGSLDALLDMLAYYPSTRPQSAAAAMERLAPDLPPAAPPAMEAATPAADAFPAPWLEAGQRQKLPAVVAARPAAGETAALLDAAETEPPEPRIESARREKPAAGRRRPGRTEGRVALALAVSFRELAVMVNSGLLISRATDLLARTVEHHRLQTAFGAITSHLENGQSVTRAFSHYPRLFGTSILGLLQAGEESGRLVPVLRHIATYLEQRQNLAMKLRSALTYPAFMFGVSLVVMAVIPSLLLNGVFAVLRDLRVEVPVTTQWLMAFTQSMQDPVTLALGLLLLATGRWLYARWMLQPQGRLQRDGLLLSLWGVGTALRYVALGSFAMALDVMYASGIPIARALRMAGQASGNSVLEQAADVAATDLENGLSLSLALERTGFFPPIAINMLAVGEEAGEVGVALQQVARMSEEEVQSRLESAVASLEPMMICVMGCVVTFICLASLGPLLSVLERLAL